jgi:hypothetical protein
MIKKLLFLVTIFQIFVTSSDAQIKFRALSSVGGASLNRGSEFEYIIQANGNGNSTTKQLLFDLMYDQKNFEIVSMNHTGTGGNGGILPQNSTIQLSWTNYPGYTWNSNTQNSTSNGTTNYQNQNYTYNGSNGDNAIIRATLTWAGTAAMPYTSYDRMIVIKFRLKASSTAYTFNPIKLNFVAGWTNAGVETPTIMETPTSTAVYMNQNYGKYVTAKVDLSSALYSLSSIKVSFRDTATNQGQLFNVTSTGDVDISQSSLAANKVYDVSVMYEMDKLYDIYNNAITISDFTTAQSEFTSMGLDGSNGQNLKTGQSLYAADINRNQKIDGGDLPRLLAQIAGLDTLVTLPAQYSMGSGGYMSIPTWKATDASSYAGQTEWCIINPNGYGQGISRLYIDMREFAGTGVAPNQIKSLQIFDIYSGPVEYISEDAYWAFFKVPSSMTKVADGTSLYIANIRNINNTNTDYALQAEFDFNVNPNNSWGSITSANWKNVTMPKLYLKTGAIGTNQFLDLKYLLWGDVNRSHSSRVILSDNGSPVIQVNSTGGFINTPNNVSAIDVTLSNMTITSNSIEVPVAINTNGANMSGLQFEFVFDESKLKFEELIANVPNSWYIFADSKNGRVKFGSLDQTKSLPIKGASVPFKLKFSAKESGVNMLTSIRVSQIMDASDDKGNQLGINLNSTQIKLTGYKNF